MSAHQPVPNLTRYLKGFLAMSVCRFEAGTFPRQPMTVPCLVHLRLINGKFELQQFEQVRYALPVYACAFTHLMSTTSLHVLGVPLFYNHTRSNQISQVRSGNADL